MKCTTNEITARMMSRWKGRPLHGTRGNRVAIAPAVPLPVRETCRGFLVRAFGPAPDIARVGFPALDGPWKAKIVEDVLGFRDRDHRVVAAARWRAGVSERGARCLRKIGEGP